MRFNNYGMAAAVIVAVYCAPTNPLYSLPKSRQNFARKTAANYLYVNDYGPYYHTNTHTCKRIHMFTFALIQL